MAHRACFPGACFAGRTVPREHRHVGSALGAVVGGGGDWGEQGGLAWCCCNPAAVTIKDSSPVHQIVKEAGRLGALLRLHLKRKTAVQASPDSPLRPRMAKCSAVISGLHGN